MYAYTAATTAILVDVVVRDKRGRPITDLTRDDFEIVRGLRSPQTVGSFSIVARASGIGIHVRKKYAGHDHGRHDVAGHSGTPPDVQERRLAGDDRPRVRDAAAGGAGPSPSRPRWRRFR